MSMSNESAPNSSIEMASRATAGHPSFYEAATFVKALSPKFDRSANIRGRGLGPRQTSGSPQARVFCVRGASMVAVGGREVRLL